jgi:hypothetical protein
VRAFMGVLGGFMGDFGVFWAFYSTILMILGG